MKLASFQYSFYLKWTTYISVVCVLFLAFIGFDTKDSVFAYSLALGDINIEFPLTILVIKTLNYVGVDSVQSYYLLALIYWLAAYLIYRRIGNKKLSDLLFVTSLFWFTGVFSYDTLILLPIACLVHYVKKENYILVIISFILMVLLKITAVAMIAPLLYYYSRTRTEKIVITILGLLLAIIAYIYVEQVRNHISLEVILSQYMNQLVLMIAAFFIGHIFFFYKGAIGMSLRILFLIIFLVYGKLFLFNHRDFAAVISGILMSIIFSTSFKNFGLCKWNLFLVGLFLMSYVGSDTGIYKSVYVLPIFATLKTEADFSKRLYLYLFTVVLLTILMKPVFFNFGDRNTTATLLKNCLMGEKPLKDLKIWNDSIHGTFVITEAQACEIRCVDSLYFFYLESGPVILGPSSTYYKTRYDIELAKPSYRGLEYIDTCDVLIWIEQEPLYDSAYEHTEVKPNIILSKTLRKK